MTKSNKLPLKKVQTLNYFVNVQGTNKMQDTDTTSVTTSSLTTTHIFKK